MTLKLYQSAALNKFLEDYPDVNEKHHNIIGATDYRIKLFKRFIRYQKWSLEDKEGNKVEIPDTQAEIKWYKLFIPETIGFFLVALFEKEFSDYYVLYIIASIPIISFFL